MSDQEVIERALKRKKKHPISSKDLLSSGSTLANLAATGRPGGCFAKGGYYWFVGDSTSGKAQPLDSLILTPSGWKQMGDICIGDPIVDPDGGEGLVTGVFPQGVKPIYQVCFSDGSKMECCADHLWIANTQNDKKHKKDRIRNTAGIQRFIHKWEEEISQRDRSSHNGNEALWIPITKPVKFKSGCNSSRILIDPYLLGVLLGDGGLTKGIVLSTMDKEIKGWVEEKARRYGCHLVQASPNRYGKVADYRIVNQKNKPNHLLNKLKRLGLFGLKSHQKFIPQQYLRANLQARKSILQGLLDTDGSGTGHGSIEYGTTSEQLASGVRELVWSLGGSCTIRSCKGKAYPYKGERKIGKEFYQLAIKLPKKIKPFRLERKYQRLKLGRKEPSRRIVSVILIGNKDCQCILTNTKRNLYITNDYVVTHNTWLALSCMAEATINPNFGGYRIIYDNSENGALMNIERFFGSKVALNLEPPKGDYKGGPEYSETVEDFYYNVDTAIKNGRPFIYVMDSMDVLEANEDRKLFNTKKAIREGRSKKEETGSYGVAKAKLNSQMLRGVVSGLRKTKSILIIISQTRDKIGFGAKFDPKTVAGGRSLKFYATLEIWTSVREKIFKTVRKKKRQLGIVSKVNIKKNRIVGRDRSVLVPIYHSIGIDDLGSCIDYLIDEGHWKGTESNVKAPEFGFDGRKEDLIHQIENDESERELRALVGEVWNTIEKACEVKRKPRYV